MILWISSCLFLFALPHLYFWGYNYISLFFFLFPHLPIYPSKFFFPQIYVPLFHCHFRNMCVCVLGVYILYILGIYKYIISKYNLIRHIMLLVHKFWGSIFWHYMTNSYALLNDWETLDFSGYLIKSPKQCQLHFVLILVLYLLLYLFLI